MTNSDIFYPPRNFAGIPHPICDLDTARVVVIPVPYDSTTEYRAAGRSGPQAIIDASIDLELFDIELERELHWMGIHTLTELQPSMVGPEHQIGRVRQAANGVLDMGKIPVMLGGEHSLTLGMVQALHERVPDLTVLQFDAHTDLRDEYLGTKYSHGCVMRRVLELCPIVQVGIRSMSQDEHRLLVERKMHPFYAHDLKVDEKTLELIISGLGPNVYITIDLDVLDPSVMASVGTPEPGGLTYYQLLTILRAVTRRRKVLGFDLVELCPREGPYACAFTAAKLAYKLMGYIA